MAIIFTLITADEKRQLRLCDPNYGAETGRYCRKPLYPDRRNCINQDLSNGACLSCAPKGQKLHKLPGI